MNGTRYDNFIINYQLSEEAEEVVKEFCDMLQLGFEQTSEDAVIILSSLPYNQRKTIYLILSYMFA